MKRKMITLLCSGLLALTLSPSAAVMAASVPAGVSAHVVSASVPLAATCPDGNHTWGNFRLIDHYEVVYESNHQCTICGARVNLYKRIDVYEETCKVCEKKRQVQTGPVGAPYSNHSCYQ